MAIYDLLVSGKGQNKGIPYNGQWKRDQKTGPQDTSQKITDKHEHRACFY